ncbi:hypothetical protein M758_3G055400 [Ceratodon purpureus]|uniref:Uncharacterized protein n=1 Tax=Ceratodon purpureus TaxID=3225 RepID=A0A8T0H7N5_CERPU|nr:hypothetical protein KC19_N035600 [Ceratodon purpureus]KAG0565092.1 hypothetical protein KC19_8G163500 [Ceratodon purpureus]KAG0621873.1 hypothetical protein M758_3G054700 [Ceratodon purpureus]KAG0621880.1 hypothetical protein M758_3G055400 [Ceratodon purpureus]
MSQLGTSAWCRQNSQMYKRRCSGISIYAIRDSSKIHSNANQMAFLCSFEDCSIFATFGSTPCFDDRVCVIFCRYVVLSYLQDNWFEFFEIQISSGLEICTDFHILCWFSMFARVTESLLRMSLTVSLTVGGPCISLRSCFSISSPIVVKLGFLIHVLRLYSYQQ